MGDLVGGRIEEDFCGLLLINERFLVQVTNLKVKYNPFAKGFQER